MDQQMSYSVQHSCVAEWPKPRRSTAGPDLQKPTQEYRALLPQMEHSHCTLWLTATEGPLTHLFLQSPFEAVCACRGTTSCSSEFCICYVEATGSSVRVFEGPLGNVAATSSSRSWQQTQAKNGKSSFQYIRKGRVSVC